MAGASPIYVTVTFITMPPRLDYTANPNYGEVNRSAAMLAIIPS